MERRKIRLGSEVLLEDQLTILRGQKIGLVCNQASVDHRLRHVADIFQATPEINLTTLFGPQHGIRGDLQDNMVETPHQVDEGTGVPVYSLYSETREPGREMLKNVDTIVFDMQDVGCRIYTFIYTLANCMRAAAKYDKKVVVCDRPNPINGVQVAGNILEAGHESFVGLFPLPTRHGMTVGELALYFQQFPGLNCELEVIPMEGWTRDLWLDETSAPWVMPSPNMPTLDTATLFPGTVHVEGTQLSEGRGTTRPFELVGAPYLDPVRLAARLNELSLSGVYYRPCFFQPTFQKHAGTTCGGVQIHVTNRREFEPVSSGLAVIKLAYEQSGEKFRWKEPPYEYEYGRNPFDVISGTKKIREAIEGGLSLREIEQSWQTALNEFQQKRQDYLLYK